MVYPQYVPCLSRFFWLAAFGWLNLILDRMGRDRPHKLLENVVFIQKTCQKIMFRKDTVYQCISFDRQHLISAFDAGCMIILCFSLYQALLFLKCFSLLFFPTIMLQPKLTHVTCACFLEYAWQKNNGNGWKINGWTINGKMMKVIFRLEWIRL